MHTDKPSRRLTMLAAAIAAVAALPAAPASAQSGKSALEEEIVVTARKRTETLETAPVAITALSSKQLNDYNITKMEDMASLAGGGVLISKNGVSPTLSIRGVSSDATNAGFDQSVGIIIDGVFYDRSRWTQMGFFDVGQVEVLKGPQALYFGKSTVAGALVMSTANPTDEFAGSGSVGYEMEGKEWYGEGWVSGPLGDNLKGRVAVRASRMKGWLENTADGFEDKNYGAEEEVTGRLTLEWDPAENLNALFKVQLARSDDDGPATRAQLYNCRGPSPFGTTITGIPADVGPVYGAPYDINDDCKLNDKITVYGGPPNLEFGQKPDGESESMMSSLKLRWTVGDFEITSVTGYNDYDYDDTTGYISSQGLITAIQSEENTAFSQELRVMSNFDGPLNFLAGFNYQDTDFTFFNSSQIILSIPDPRNGRAASQAHTATQDGESMSGFAELTWDITPELQFSGGARYTHEEKDAGYDLTFVNQWFGIIFPFPFWLPEGTSLRYDYSDNNVSPQATLKWTPTDDLMLFASYKTGYLPGGFSLGATPQAGLRLRDFTFEHEEVEGFELGAKMQFLDDRLSVDLTYFDYEYTDLQVNLYVPTTASFVVGNAGEATTQGAELGARFHVTESLLLRAQISYNDAEYDNYRTQCYTLQTLAQGCAADGTQDLSGASLPRAPKWTWGMGGSYTVPVGSQFNLTFGGDIYWSDDYQIETTNNPYLVQDSYTRVDASLALETIDGHWRAALFGRNLTNEEITSFGATRGFTNDQLAELLRLREVSLQLTYNF